MPATILVVEDEEDISILRQRSLRSRRIGLAWRLWLTAGHCSVSLTFEKAPSMESRLIDVVPSVVRVKPFW